MFGRGGEVTRAPDPPCGSWRAVEVMADNYPNTRAKLEAAGRQVYPVALTELQKAEAGGSCMSIVFDEPVGTR